MMYALIICSNPLTLCAATLTSECRSHKVLRSFEPTSLSYFPGYYCQRSVDLPKAGPRLILTKVSSLKASEELKLRRGVLHTDAVRHAVGGSSLRLATWAALGCPPHHVIVITWYDGPTPSSPSVPHRSPLDDTCPNMFSPSPGLAGRETTNLQFTCIIGRDEVIIIMRSTFLKRH